MKKDINKIIFIGICGILTFACGFLGGKLFYGLLNNEELHYCLVRPMVYDAFTGEAIPNATVINTLDGNSYTTDSNGSTDWISVYYNEYESATLNAFIAVADGYKRTLVYAVFETAREPLDGPLIYMFTGKKSDVVSMVYSPSDEYTKNLAENFN